MENFESNVLIEFSKEFRLIIDPTKSSDENVVLRGDLKSSEDVDEFMEELKKVTHTEWISYYHIKNPTRCVYHKVWKCQHSDMHKRSQETIRNAACFAKVDVKIKKVNYDTKKNDPYLKSDPPLPCVIQLSLHHSHEIENADHLRMLRVNEEVRMRFIQYFVLGMGPAESKHHHDSFVKENQIESFALASVRPTLRQIQHLYNVWRDASLGFHDPLERIVEKIPFYEDRGVTVKVFETNPWAVLVVTPLMKRVQNLERAQEVIFVDSTASVEVTGSVMTVMLTATKIGALPIAAFVHESQSSVGYISGMQLLKNNFPTCFGNKEHPEVFMTDDSAAEKSALQLVWPGAKQLLCHFHVAQAEWRWLHSKNSGVPLEEKKRLMKLFQSVMYTNDEEELQKSYQKVQNEGEKYPKFVKRFNDFFQRRDEWLSLDRRTLLLRRNYTNNYSEAMMRILKDVILQRTKASCITSLIEYCMSTWEDVLVTKLLDFAYCRRRTSNKTLVALAKKMSKFSAQDIVSVSEGVFSVPSASVPNSRYIVDTSLGTCTCLDGIGGGFCKHQCFLSTHMGIIMPNAPILSDVERYNLAVVAVGVEKCQPIAYFKNFTAAVQPSITEKLDINLNEECVSGTTEVPSQEFKIEYASEEEKKGLKEKLVALVDGDIPKHLVLNLSKSIDAAIKGQQQRKTLQTIAYSLKARYSRLKKIKVQPTSIARRRPGSTKGHGRLPAGRPLSRPKRIRNLSKNIEKNQPNAISHGSGH